MLSMYDSNSAIPDPTRTTFTVIGTTESAHGFHFLFVFNGHPKIIIVDDLSNKLFEKKRDFIVEIRKSMAICEYVDDSKLGKFYYMTPIWINPPVIGRTNGGMRPNVITRTRSTPFEYVRYSWRKRKPKKIR